MQSMHGMKFYVLVFGTIVLLWAIVTVFGTAVTWAGHPSRGAASSLRVAGKCDAGAPFVTFRV